MTQSELKRRLKLNKQARTLLRDEGINLYFKRMLHIKLRQAEEALISEGGFDPDLSTKIDCLTWLIDHDDDC